MNLQGKFVDMMGGAFGVFFWMLVIGGGIFWYQEWALPSMGTMLIFVFGAFFGAIAMYFALDMENEEQRTELAEHLATLEKAQQEIEKRRENIDAEIDELRP